MTRPGLNFPFDIMITLQKWVLASAVLALGSLVLLATKPLAALDKRYVDMDGDLVADTPAKTVAPPTLVFAYTPVRIVRSMQAYGMPCCCIWKS